MTDLDSLWRLHAGKIPGVLERRPDFRFDPDHYCRQVSGVANDPQSLFQHFQEVGLKKGLHPTLFTRMIKERPDLGAALEKIVTDPDLVRMIEADLHDVHHLACELILLGAPVDTKISDFSMKHYLAVNADIERSGVNPLMHFLFFGMKEGRKSLADVRKTQFRGTVEFATERPTCLIVVHEFSRTGAPIVGRDLVKEASQTHNVIVASLRGGDLLEEFCHFACEVVVTQQPLIDFPYYQGEIFRDIDFAITNSVECMPYVPMLVACEIPFAAYVHEYTSYTFPTYKSTFTALFTDLLIFSSEHVRGDWAGCLKDIEFDTARDSAILPQRSFSIGTVDAVAVAEARARLSKLIGRDLANVRLICGAGHMQWRKGTDIFAMTAQICQDPKTVFVWIGDGLNFEDLQFGAWMTYHLRQIGADQPGSNLYILPAGPAYPDVLTAADAMFVSSRLDPLPNVVFDALDTGCRIVLFEGASGFCDGLYRDSDHFIRVPYANPAAAAAAIESLPRKTPQPGLGPQATLKLFDRIRQALQDRLAAQRYFVRGASQIDVPMLFSSEEHHREFRVHEREKMLRYGRRLVWRDLDEVREELAASDNWVHRKLRLAPYGVSEGGGLPDFSIHLHAFYTDDLSSDVQQFRAYHLAKRIVVTTDTEKKADEIKAIMGAEGLVPEISLVGNRGRDILPFLELFYEGGIARQDDIWCHLHQKKSFGTTDRGDVWRRFLMRILLGDETGVSDAVRLIGQDEVGFVAPFDPFFIPWNASRALLPKFAARLPGPMPGNPLLFPVGNMFWVRRAVVLAMNGIFGQTYPWPSEPIPNDGTEFHLIERLWPAITTHTGLESVFVHKLDQARV